MFMRFSFQLRGDVNSKRVGDYLKKECLKAGWEYRPDDPEIILSIGGDGTLLRAIHKYIDCLDKIMFVGIHTGTLGFFTDYTQDELELFLDDIVNQKPYIEESPLLEFDIPEKEFKDYALNEIRIESLEKTLYLDIYIDGEFFERTTGSGICLSTQAGSTAVNRALKGAVVDSGLQVLQLCEIMPISHKIHHTLLNPYIMKSDREVVIRSVSLHNAEACYDHLHIGLNDVNEIHMKTSEKKVRFVRYSTYSYLKRLKNLY